MFVSVRPFYGELDYDGRTDEYNIFPDSFWWLAMFAKFLTVLFLIACIAYVTEMKRVAKRKWNKVKQNSLCRQSGSTARSFNMTFEICDEICVDGECTIYSCPDGVCCTPGSPESLCCPLDHPLCEEEGCCPVGHPQICGEYCCTPTSTCCPDGCCEDGEQCCADECCNPSDGELCCIDECCDKGEECCSNGCCEVGEVCCGAACCKAEESCCGDSCCGSDKCCMNSCCDGPNQVCCGQSGCNNICPSIFEINPCPQPSQNIKMNKPIEIGLKNDMNTSIDIFRVLRAGEICSKMMSLNPNASNTVQDHILCQPNIKTQFLSFTFNLTLAKIWYNIYKTKTSTPGIAKVSVASIPPSCNVYNLTNSAIRSKYLTNDLAIAKAIAQNATVVEVPSGQVINGTCISVNSDVNIGQIQKKVEEVAEVGVYEFEIADP